MTHQEVRIRRMNRDDIGLAVEWAAGEGWNPGLHDADAFFSADPNGFFIAELDSEPVGCISAVAYDDTFGFMGFYIVKKELRHLGIGMKLWNASLAYLGNRTIGGDGVVAMLEKYAQFDFRIAHQNARYEGTGKEAQSALADISRVSFTDLEQYDRRFFPAPRTAFLKSWISRPGSCGRVVFDNHTITGYGVIRPCHRGFKIAPLFADTPQIAEELFSSLSGLAAGQPIFLDIPSCNQAAVQLVERQGMNKVFETARIYRGTPPELPLDSIYGITSFELG
jgi:GNAT superfamily N-acetyltransferase